MAVDKYIVAKSFFMGFIRKSVGKGTILTVDKDAVSIEGETFNDVRDVKIALRISQGGEKLLVPYKDSDPSVKRIVAEVKAKLKASAPAKTAPAMKIMTSEGDLRSPVDISGTCVSKKAEEKKREIAESRKKQGEMKIIRDAESETAIGSMKIIKSDEDSEATKKPAPLKKKK